MRNESLRATVIEMNGGYWIAYDSDFVDDHFITKVEYTARFGTAPHRNGEKRK